MMAERRLLEPIAHDLQKGTGERLWLSLAAVDAYRKRHDESPDTLSNAVLLGSLLVPLGMTGHARPPARTELEKEPPLSLGMLPLARRDVERFRQILGLQRRLLDSRLSPRARRALMHRGPFREALAWLEIHGEAPEAVEHWRGFIEASGIGERDREGGQDLPPRRRRRRRRRRSFRPVTN
jgi:poly(A) polymerase-like protein